MAESKSVRLRNTTTGAVVEVREGKVALLGSEWEPAEQEAEKPAARRRTASKSE